MIRILIPMLLLYVSALNVQAQQRPDFVKFINAEHGWVDSVFNSLSPKERIAQLFLVRAHSNLGQAYIDSVAQVIQNEQLGGLVVFQGGPVRHARMINRYQELSKTPLLVTSDGEWGVGMRLPDSTISYPYQMTLGAIQNNELIYEMGEQIAKDFKRIGMHFNFAPVVDINNNPRNPVISFRSFGDNKYQVTEKAGQFMKGMLGGGIIASLKHFPGHGDTDVDSHHDLPLLSFSKERLDSMELFPFRKLISSGASGVMVAHMQIPALDQTANIPSSISGKVVTDLLKNELEFKGLVVTDAMDMQGVKKYFPDGEADVMAIEAGNDLLEISENSARAIDLVEKAIRDGRIQQSDLDRRVKKVLASKYWLGLDRYNAVNVHNLVEDLNSHTAKNLVRRLAEAAITVLKSDKGIKAFDTTEETAVVSVGLPLGQAFEKNLVDKLDHKKVYVVTGEETAAELKVVLKEARRSQQIVLALHDNRPRPGSVVPMSDDVKKFVSKIAGKRTITVMFTNPYVLDQVKIKRSRSVVLAYQNDFFMQEAALRVVLSEIKAQGKLPVSINKQFGFGSGF